MPGLRVFPSATRCTSSRMAYSGKYAASSGNVLLCEPMTEKRVVIAIDGPAGAGKSTVARRVAERLGYAHISTGALYRAVALWALRLGTELTDMYRLTQLAQEARIELLPENGRVLLNGEDVTEAIRLPEVSDAASKISAVPGVRRALLPVQRAIAQENSVVMEGRDIGSVVFPEAQVKIFLDADPAERVQRRALEREHEGETANTTQVAGELRARDQRDRTRREAPLLQAPDAELVDTTGLSLDEVEEIVLRLVRSRISNGKAVANSAADTRS
ncbi:MAG TPA: (d)CMP kinase [Bryobacteraceae bacterium]